MNQLEYLLLLGLPLSIGLWLVIVSSINDLIDMLSTDWKIKVDSYTKEISNYKNENKEFYKPVKVKILVLTEDRKSAKNLRLLQC